MNAIVTFANGVEFCRNPLFQVFLKSIKTSHFQGDVVIFTQDMDESIRPLIINDSCCDLTITCIQSVLNSAACCRGGGLPETVIVVEESCCQFR
jgi:hypothetical protein